MESIASRIRTDLRNFGIAKTAYEVFVKGVNLCSDLRIIRVFKNETVDPRFLESSEGFQWRFLDERQMFELSRNPFSRLTESFVRTALDKGDQCYAGFDGETLACYGWYSDKPTDDEGLTFHFSPGYIYGYAAQTYPKYRGRRLQTIRVNRVMREYLGRGFIGMVSAIDSHNFRSLRSVSRLGVRDIGYILVLKTGKYAWIHNSRGCRDDGIFLAQPSAADPRRHGQLKGSSAPEEATPGLHASFPRR